MSLTNFYPFEETVAALLVSSTFFVLLGSATASFLFCLGNRLLQKSTGQQSTGQKTTYPKRGIFARSQCPKCNIKLPFYTLIPLLSYLFLLGKCHSCKKNISIVYPLSEIIYAALFVLVWQKLGFVWASPLFLFCWSLLFFIAFLDWQVQWFYSSLLLLIFVAQSIYLYFYPEMLLDAFLGMTVGAGFLYFVGFFYQFLFSREGIGSGDISLLGILGYLLGVQSLLPILLYSSLGGLLIGVGFLIKYKKNVPFPFVPALVSGAFLHWYLPSLYAGFVGF